MDRLCLTYTITETVHSTTQTTMQPTCSLIRRPLPRRNPIKTAAIALSRALYYAAAVTFGALLCAALVVVVTAL
jgi:hypothetical protein